MKLFRVLSVVACCGLLLAASSASANLVGTNLVDNGDFESGAAGFTSQYDFALANDGATGEFTVTTNPSLWNSSFNNPSTPTGQMLVANGSESALDSVWGTTLDVMAGRSYQVSFDAVSLSGDTNKSRLRFYASLPDDPVAASPVATANLEDSNSEWVTGTGSFVAAETGSISVFINNLEEYAGGFAIDNVTVVPEPSSLALVGIGSLIGLGLYTRRRRRNA